MTAVSSPLPLWPPHAHGLGSGIEEGRWLSAEPVGPLYQREERHVRAANFDALHVVDADPEFSGQLLLGEAAPLAESGDTPSHVLDHVLWVQATHGPAQLGLVSGEVLLLFSGTFMAEGRDE